jgi:hypothetical protein
MRAGRTAVGVCRHINHRECGVVNIVNIVSIVSRRFFQRVIRRFFGGEQHEFDFSENPLGLSLCNPLAGNLDILLFRVNPDYLRGPMI